MRKPPRLRESARLARLQFKYTQILQVFSQLMQAEHERVEAVARNLRG